jgi:hypothetical protein
MIALLWACGWLLALLQLLLRFTYANYLLLLLLLSRFDVCVAEELTGSSESGEEEEEEEDEEMSEDGEEPEPKRRRLNRLGSSVVRSATVLARTLVACEEKRERRHREVLELEERRLRLEEQRTEARRQGFAGLISAVNSLSGAIHALVADHRSGDSASR